MPPQPRKILINPHFKGTVTVDPNVGALRHPSQVSVITCTYNALIYLSPPVQIARWAIKYAY